MMFMWIIPVVLLFLLLDRPDRSRDSRTWVLGVILLAGLVLGGMWTMGGYMGGHMRGYSGWTGWTGWGWAVGLGLLILLGAAGYLALRRGDSDSEEMRILRLRLARGELTTEEYDLLRQKLK